MCVNFLCKVIPGVYFKIFKTTHETKQMWS